MKCSNVRSKSKKFFTQNFVSFSLQKITFGEECAWIISRTAGQSTHYPLQGLWVSWFYMNLCCGDYKGFFLYFISDLPCYS